MEIIEWNEKTIKLNDFNRMQIGYYDDKYNTWIYYYDPDRYEELLNTVKNELDYLVSLGYKKTKIKDIFIHYIKSARQDRDKRLEELKIDIRENGWVKKNDPLQLEKKDVIDEFVIYKMAIKEILNQI